MDFSSAFGFNGPNTILELFFLRRSSMGQTIWLCSVDIVLFDFGGVLAEEGFANGLREIGKINGFDPGEFFETGRRLVHETGYVTGSGGEAAYWDALRRKTSIKQDDEFLRNEILSRFIPRPWMLDMARRIKKAGIKIGILSDQTNWLDELNARYDFFREFDVVFNSYHTGQSKRDPAWFIDVASILKLEPGRILFIDDNAGNCARARQSGMKTIHYMDRSSFSDQIAFYCPLIPPGES